MTADAIAEFIQYHTAQQAESRYKPMAARSVRLEDSGREVRTAFWRVTHFTFLRKAAAKRCPTRGMR
jgi:hypothetical protein